MNGEFISERMRAEAVESRTVNENHVFDTSGRYHGELTGKNDAAVVNDAIEDRSGTAGIVIPDPGFVLDWNEQVELPPSEHGFAIESLGVPELQFPSNFDGEYAIYKPEEPDDGAGYHYTVGRFYFNDEVNEVLERAIYLDDTRGGLIRPSWFEECPAIYIGASNHWSNQNMIVRPYIRSGRGPGIELERGDPELLADDEDQEADQNWIVAPFYTERMDRSEPEEYTETAYREHGRGNMWLLSRAEHCNTVHHQKGANRYIIIEGQWDRTSEITNFVKEEWDNELHGDPASSAYGTIITNKAEHFAKSRIINPHTLIEAAGRRQSTAEPIEFSGLTTAHSLASRGLRDASEGGEVTIDPDDADRGPSIVLRTDGDSGDRAVLDSGPRTWGDIGLNPKLFLDTEVDTNENVLVRLGFYADEDDRCELIYDPTESRGTLPGDPQHWHLELVTNGSVRAREDTGVYPYSWSRRIILQREGEVDLDGRDPFVNWSVHVSHGADESDDDYEHTDRVYEKTVVKNEGDVLAADDNKRFRFRVSIEALEDSEKVLKFDNRRKLQALVR